MKTTLPDKQMSPVDTKRTIIDSTASDSNASARNTDGITSSSKKNRSNNTTSLVDESTSSNHGIPDIPQLITECHYDTTEFEVPTLHSLISNGKVEEAKRMIGRSINDEAISYKCFLERKVKVEDRVENNPPRQVESFSPVGYLPIHSFFGCNNIDTNLSEEQRMELLELLLNELPEGPRTRVLNDFALPLSLACEPSINFSKEECINCEPSIYSLSIDSTTDTMIRLLIDKYPTATIVLFGLNQSALHIMLEHRPNLELTKYFVETSKSARHSAEDRDKVIHGSLLEHGNKDEQLPIHTAIEYYAPCDVIQYLIDEFPGGLKEKMYNGDLPLHCAARFGCRSDVLDSLLCEKKGFSAAVAVENSNGFTPLQLLLDNQELWNPDYFVPQIKCEAATKKRIISYYKERACYQIKPNNIVSAYRFLRRMIEAYYKHLIPTLKQEGASAMIQSFLRDQQLLKSIQKLGQTMRQVQEAKEYIKQLMDKGLGDEKYPDELDEEDDNDNDDLKRNR